MVIMSRVSIKPQFIFKAILALFLLTFFLLPTSVFATAGVNRTINFQGKLVNKTSGTNISDNTYSFTFKFYDASSGGTQLPSGAAWSETQSIAVSNGIFRATLGASTPIPSTLDFNDDSIYLDITFNGETFGSRVRMTAVPYAFNAEKVGGLTVTNTTGTLTIQNGKTISFGDAFTTSGAYATTLTSTATTNVTLPTSGLLFSDTNNINFLDAATGTAYSIAGSDATSGTNAGGNLTVRAGNGSTSGTGGDLVLAGGTTSGGTAGNLTFQTAGSTRWSITNTGAFASNGAGTITSTSGDITIDPTGNTVIKGSTTDNSAAALQVKDSSNGSLLYVRNDGNVGIGTTAPDAQLHVKSATSTTFTFESGGTMYDAQMDFARGGSNHTYIGPASSGTFDLWSFENIPFRFAVNNSEKFRISAAGGFSFGNSYVGTDPGAENLILSGSMGIGTTGPAAKLHVLSGTGNIVFDSPFSGYGGIGFQSTLSTTNYFAVGNSSETVINTPSGTWLTFANNNSPIARFDSAGYLGLGTTSPLERLDVSGNASVSGNFTLAGGVRTIGSRSFNSLTLGDSQTGNILLNPGTNKRIGIGLTEPQDLLDVGVTASPDCSSFRVSNGSTSYLRLRPAVESCSSMTLEGYDVGGNGLSFDVNLAKFRFIQNGGTYPTVSLQGTSGDSIVLNADGDTYFAGGNVGIGNTTPLEALDVSGNATVSGNLSFSGVSTIASRSMRSLNIGDNQTGTVFLQPKGPSATGWVQIGVGGAGSTTPDLLVLDSKSDAEGGFAGANGAMYYNANSNKFRCYQNGGWTDCIGSGGTPLWSGIQAPTGNLSLSMSTYTTAFNWATGTSSNDLFSLTTDASANGTGALLNIQTGSSATVLPLRVRAGSVESIYVTAAGLVGIGNTNPLEKLDVNGNASIGGNLTFSGLRTIAGRAFNDFTIGDTQTGNIFLTAGTAKNINFYSTSNNINSSGNLTLAGTISAATSGTINGVSISAAAVSGVTTLSMNNQLTNSYANSAALNLTGSGAGITFTNNSTHNISASAGSLQINGLTVTSSTGTLTVTNAKTLSISNTLTFGGTDSTSFTFPSTTGGTVITTNQSSQTISNTQASGTVLSVSDTSLTTGTGLAVVGGTAMTTGTDLDINGAVYTHAAAETGNLSKFTFTDNTNVAGASTTNGLNISSTFNLQGASGAKVVRGLYVANPTINGCSGGTTCTWDGAEIDLTANTTSTVTQQGLYIKPSASQNTSGSVLGIFIDNANQGSATETGLKIGTGWDNGLDVSSPTQISSTLTATNTTTVGSAGNTFTFNPTSGPAYAGTARPYKIITLSPEYIGGSISTFYGAGTDSTNNTGTMTSDVDSTANAFRNYYSWTSTTASPLQSYTIAVRVTLPQDFSQWCTTSTQCTDTNAIVVNLVTSNTSSSNNAIDTYIYRTDSTTTAVYSNTNSVSSSGGTWTTLNIAKASLEGTTTWNTAGQSAIIFLRMRAMNSNSVKVGNIKLNYLGSY